MAYEQKPNTGSIHKNKRKTQDTHPNATGDVLVTCPHCQQLASYFVDAWTNDSKKNPGEKYQSLKLKPKDKQPAQQGSASSSQQPSSQQRQPDPDEEQYEEDIPF